ncbi:hypothetical protein [Aurantimonas endophytica]|uniref:hypothetical protein n=1 Tax=Aurantimonas endophytica TaxID=1522175 RepID=UPI0030032E9F
MLIILPLATLVARVVKMIGVNFDDPADYVNSFEHATEMFAHVKLLHSTLAAAALMQSECFNQPTARTRSEQIPQMLKNIRRFNRNANRRDYLFRNSVSALRGNSVSVVSIPSKPISG